MMPEEAVQAFEDLDAKQAVAVHWGTFKLTSEPLPNHRNAQELNTRRGFAADRFLAPAMGRNCRFSSTKFPKRPGSDRLFSPFCSGRHSQTRP